MSRAWKRREDVKRSWRGVDTLAVHLEMDSWEKSTQFLIYFKLSVILCNSMKR